MDPNAHTQYRFLYDLLANPATLGHENAGNLNQLVKSHPQSGILQALLAYANEGRNLQQAAVSFNPLLLHKIINSPASLHALQAGQVFYQSAQVGLKGAPVAPQPVIPEPEITEEETTAEIADPATIDEMAAPSDEAGILEKKKEDIEGTEESETTTEPQVDEITGEEATVDEAAEETPVETTEAEQPETTEEETVTEETPAEEPEVVEEIQAEDTVEEEQVTEEEISEEQPEAEEAEPIAEEPKEEEEPVAEETPSEEKITEPEAAETEISAEEEPVAEPEAVKEETIAEEKPAATADEPATSESEIEDEIYDEIVGIEDIAIDVNQAESGATFHDGTVLNFEDPYSAEDTRQLMGETSSPAENTFRLDDEADKLIVGNIAATDYFMFDKAFGKIEEAEQVSKQEPQAELVTPVVAAPQPQPEPIAAAAADTNEVATYHDDKMPYSFLWWLDKTRREHSGIYQPYSKSVANRTNDSVGRVSTDALEHQYIENIFHLTSVEQLDKSTAKNTTSQTKHKGDALVERFIKEEPQIRPPSSEKLDTENKAKKSAEDVNELVSETLAKIYADQMMYPKAISVYKKLMLKFPEKSRYFADRIESLEKRTS